MTCSFVESKQTRLSYNGLNFTLCSFPNNSLAWCSHNLHLKEQFERLDNDTLLNKYNDEIIISNNATKFSKIILMKSQGNFSFQTIKFLKSATKFSIVIELSKYFRQNQILNILFINITYPFPSRRSNLCSDWIDSLPSRKKRLGSAQT